MIDIYLEVRQLIDFSGIISIREKRIDKSKVIKRWDD